MRVVQVFRPVVAALLVAMSGVAPAGAVPAVVTDAKALNVRRGPGTEHQVFAQLTRGQEVEVTKVAGAWASVRTQGGAEGWVQKRFLAFPGGQPQPPAENPPEPPVSDAPPSSSAEELQRLRDDVARLTAERDALREEFAHPAPAAAGVETPHADAARLQADVQQLLQLTQELRQMVASQRERGSSAPAGAAAPAEGDSRLLSNGWVLTTSLIVGVLGGMVYGRAQERRRRNRIRF